MALFPILRILQLRTLLEEALVGDPVVTGKHLKVAQRSMGLSEGQPRIARDALNVLFAFFVFFGGFQMFQHEWRVDPQPR